MSHDATITLAHRIISGELQARRTHFYERERQRTIIEMPPLACLHYRWPRAKVTSSQATRAILGTSASSPTSWKILQRG
jgi:hypothetical protein